MTSIEFIYSYLEVYFILVNIITFYDIAYLFAIRAIEINPPVMLSCINTSVKSIN